MTTFSFLDDYSEGAHPDILRSLTESNLTQQAPYGADAYSAEAAKKIAAHLGNAFNGAIHFVASGTIANIVSIASCLRPHEAVIRLLAKAWAHSDMPVRAYNLGPFVQAREGLHNARKRRNCTH